MIIYKCTNKVNGKYYIGKTKNSLSERISQHKSEAKCNKDNTLCAFHNALNKYGFENFIWEVIDTTQTEDDLNAREAFWIDKLKSLVEFGRGYNINSGGEGGDNFTNNPNKEFIRKRISQAVKCSKRWTPERKREASEKFKQRNPMKLYPEKSTFVTDNPMKKSQYKRIGPKNPMADLKVREKHKKRINDPIVKEKIARGVSKALQGRTFSREHIIHLSRTKSKFYWAKYDAVSHNLLEIYESALETGESTKLCNPYPSSLQKGYKLLNNYIWINYRKDEIAKQNIPAIFRQGL